MRIKKILLIIVLVFVMVFALFSIIKGAVALHRTEEVLIKNDEFEEWYENHSVLKKKAERAEFQPSWQMQLIAKIVGFESGYCCEKCQYYVASACVNRKD